VPGGNAVRIILQYFDGCPSWRVADERVREALARLGVDEGDLVLQEVATEEDAARLAFAGSPTILVDGLDVFDDRTAVSGLACRRYRTGTGLEGSPSVDQLVTALSRA
jgi:hypothetical protein